MKAAQEYSAQVADYEILNFKVKESFNPKLPQGVIAFKDGMPTISPTARGYIENSSISLSNANLSHVCGFRLGVGINMNLLGGLPNPASLIAKAIRNAKNKAAAWIRKQLGQLIDGLRKILNLIIAMLGMDPSGQISAAISLGKSLIRDINYWANKIAQAIEDALVPVFIVQQIIALLKYIASLPKRFQALLQSCLKNFQNSLSMFAKQVKGLPGSLQQQLTSQMNILNGQLKATLKVTENAFKSYSNDTTVSQFLPVINSPNSLHVTSISNHLNSTYSSPNETMTQANRKACLP